VLQVNGKKVHEEHATRPAAGLDVVDGVRLEKGTNRFLLRSRRGEGSGSS